MFPTLYTGKQSRGLYEVFYLCRHDIIVWLKMSDLMSFWYAIKKSHLPVLRAALLAVAPSVSACALPGGSFPRHGRPVQACSEATWTLSPEPHPSSSPPRCRGGNYEIWFVVRVAAWLILRERMSCFGTYQRALSYIFALCAVTCSVFQINSISLLI